MKRIFNSRGLNRQVFAAAFVCLLLVSCAVAGFASEGAEGAHEAGHAAAQMKDFMWRVIDFAALFGILFWALKKADMKGSLASRQAAIDKTLREAEEARQSAEKKYAEYSEKLATANKEVDEIYAAIKLEGEAEKKRIIDEAHAAAERIREQARQAAGQEVLKAKVELREEAARLAVELATKTLLEQTKKDDQDRLVGEYLSKVVELH